MRRALCSVVCSSVLIFGCSGDDDDGGDAPPASTFDLHCVLFNASGQPLPAASVAVAGQQATTAIDGTFVVAVASQSGSASFRITGAGVATTVTSPIAYDISAGPLTVFAMSTASYAAIESETGLSSGSEALVAAIFTDTIGARALRQSTIVDGSGTLSPAYGVNEARMVDAARPYPHPLSLYSFAAAALPGTVTVTETATASDLTGTVAAGEVFLAIAAGIPFQEGFFGRLSDWFTGAVVAGADVELSDGAATVDLVTDASGIFYQLGIADADGYAARISKAGYVTVVYPTLAKEYYGYEFDAFVTVSTADFAALETDLEAALGTTIDPALNAIVLGDFCDEDGPLIGAAAAVDSPGGVTVAYRKADGAFDGSLSRAAYAGAQGPQFMTTNCAPGTVTVSEGWQGAFSASADAGAAEVAILRFREMTPRAQVSVQVRSTGGGALAGAAVDFVGPSGDLLATTTTDGSGQVGPLYIDAPDETWVAARVTAAGHAVTLGHLEWIDDGGSWTVTVLTQTEYDGVLAAYEAEHGALATATYGLVIASTGPSSAAIEGDTYAPADAPLKPGDYYTGSDFTATATVPAGGVTQYVAGDYPVGQSALVASAWRRTVRFRAEADAVTLLNFLGQPEGTFSGTVLDATDSTPVSGIQVAFNDAPWPTSAVVTDAAGTFSFDTGYRRGRPYSFKLTDTRGTAAYSTINTACIGWDDGPAVYFYVLPVSDMADLLADVGAQTSPDYVTNGIVLGHIDADYWLLSGEAESPVAGEEVSFDDAGALVLYDDGSGTALGGTSTAAVPFRQFVIADAAPGLSMLSFADSPSPVGDFMLESGGDSQFFGPHRVSCFVVAAEPTMAILSHPYKAAYAPSFTMRVYVYGAVGAMFASLSGVYGATVEIVYTDGATVVDTRSATTDASGVATIESPPVDGDVHFRISKTGYVPTLTTKFMGTMLPMLASSGEGDFMDMPMPLMPSAFMTRFAAVIDARYGAGTYDDSLGIVICMANPGTTITVDGSGELYELIEPPMTSGTPSATVGYYEGKLPPCLFNVQLGPRTLILSEGGVERARAIAPVEAGAITVPF